MVTSQGQVVQQRPAHQQQQQITISGQQYAQLGFMHLDSKNVPSKSVSGNLI